MSTNKKFRIQNGADIHGGGLSIDDVIVIGADGKVVAGAIQDAVASLTAADIADLQSQVTAILGTSPETLDTLQEIVTAFQDADTNLVASVAATAASVEALENSVGAGAALTVPSDPTIINYEEVLGAVYQIATNVDNKIALYQSNNFNSVEFIEQYGTSTNQRLRDNWGQRKMYVTGDALFVGMTEDLGGASPTLAEYNLVPSEVHSDSPVGEYPGMQASGTNNQYLRNIYADDDYVVACSDGGHGWVKIWTRGDFTSQPITLSKPVLNSNYESWGRTVYRANDYLIVGGYRSATVHNFDGSLVKTLGPYLNLGYAGNLGGPGNGNMAMSHYGNMLLIGAPEAQMGQHSQGAALLFDLNDLNVAPTVIASPDVQMQQNYGYTVHIDADYIVIGGPQFYNNGNNGERRGIVTVAPVSNPTSPQLMTAQSHGINDYYKHNFGKHVSVRENTLIVSADGFEGPDDSGKGGVLLFDITDLSVSPTLLELPGTGEDYPRVTWVSPAANVTQSTSALIVPSAGVVPAVNYLEDKTNDMQSDIDALSSLQSGDTSSLTTAIATAKSEAISTAAADATTKADDAKAYADQVVAATVDAAPAALDTLNELAAALGDDANFASTVTASIATKADDAATTAALDLKEDKTTVATLDTYVKGAPPVHAELFSTSLSAYYVNNGGSNSGNTVSGSVFTRASQPYIAHQTITGLTVGEDYTFSATTQSTSGQGQVFIFDGSVSITSGNILDASKCVTVVSLFAPGTDYSKTFTATKTSMDIAFNVNVIGSSNALRLSGLSLKTDEPPTVSLDTTATQVVPAINEVHAELDALSATQSGDTSSLTSAIATAKSEAISTASADATAKADAAETDAKAYADQVVAATVDAAPAALDTLNELAAALGDDANFASTVTTSIATKASQVDHDAEVARATAAEVANAAAIAAANSRTSGISTSSGSTDIKMTAEVDMDSNNIKNANDVYAARGFIDHIESNDLKVQTGTVDFEGSIVNFGSSTITGGGFGNATKAEIDQHLNIPTANAGEFVKWTGTDYEWTDLVSGRLATDQLQIASGGSITATGPGGTFDFQDGIVMLSGSDVRVDTPTDVGQAANKGYVDAETTLVAGDGISVDNLTHTVSLDGSAISQNLVPSDDNLYTLGSPDKVWKDVYIGPGSLYIGGQKVIEDNAGTITVNADPDQNLTVQTTGTGGLNVQSTGSGGISIDAASEAVQVKSDMVVSVGKTITTVGGAATKFGGDIDMQTNTVSGLGAPSMDADAATKLYVDDRIAEGTVSGSKTFSDNVIVSGNLTVSGTTTTVNSETISLADNIIDLNSNLTSGAPSEDAGIRIMRGDASAVQLRWNETSDHWETYNGSAWTKIALSTSDLAEGSNQYFTEERAKACLTGGLCITYSSVTGEIKVDQAEAESTLRVAESVASDDADKLDGQEGTYYRINVYNVAGTLVN
jgi:hypothetical protein